MKSIYPTPDESIILDVLAGNDNNIQKASEVLSDMGYARKDTVKIAQQQAEAKIEEKRVQEEIENKPPTPPPPPPKIKTSAEKEARK